MLLRDRALNSSKNPLPAVETEVACVDTITFEAFSPPNFSQLSSIMTPSPWIMRKRISSWLPRRKSGRTPLLWYVRSRSTTWASLRPSMNQVTELKQEVSCASDGAPIPHNLFAAVRSINLVGHARRQSRRLASLERRVDVYGGEQNRHGPLSKHFRER